VSELTSSMVILCPDLDIFFIALKTLFDIGWQGTNQETLQTKELEIKGKIPQDLNGYFYHKNQN
jgi:hypothetical protein